MKNQGKHFRLLGSEQFNYGENNKYWKWHQKPIYSYLKCLWDVIGEQRCALPVEERN